MDTKGSREVGGRSTILTFLVLIIYYSAIYGVNTLVFILLCIYEHDVHLCYGLL